MPEPAFPRNQAFPDQDQKSESGIVRILCFIKKFGDDNGYLQKRFLMGKVFPGRHCRYPGNRAAVSRGSTEQYGDSIRFYEVRRI